MSNFYFKAAEILGKLEEKKATIKALVFSDDVPDKKRMFALVCETLKCLIFLRC